IEVKKAWALRRRCAGIDGDDFEISSIVELEHAVVRPHRWMLAARLGAYAESRFDVVVALSERRRRDDQMIDRHGAKELRATFSQPASGIIMQESVSQALFSSAAKSISILAPLGSWKNNCQTPDCTCLRHSCSM